MRILRKKKHKTFYKSTVEMNNFVAIDLRKRLVLLGK